MAYKDSGVRWLVRILGNNVAFYPKAMPDAMFLDGVKQLNSKPD